MFSEKIKYRNHYFANIRFVACKCFQFGWLIVLWHPTQFSTLFQPYHGSQCIDPCSCRVLVNSTPYSIFSKLLGAFPHYHHWWERNKTCCYECRQSLESIIDELGITPATTIRSSIELNTGQCICPLEIQYGDDSWHNLKILILVFWT